jgi:hypothetical protein
MLMDGGDPDIVGASACLRPDSDDRKDGVVHQVVRVIVGDHREPARNDRLR